MSSIAVDIYTKPIERNTEKYNEPFEFTGNASEYFNIWIVNVCLSILTLGIYSAWAKVRTTRYFYGNTKLAGASFDYIAKPENILKGRIIAALFFVAWYGILSYAPRYEIVLFFAMLLITPWLIVKSLSFRARNTTYRNIRFDFHGTYSRAMMVYWGYLLFVTIFTGGLAYPWALNKKQQFIISHSAYGTKRFSFSSSTGKYYALMIKAFLWIVFFIFMDLFIMFDWFINQEESVEYQFWSMFNTEDSYVFFAELIVVIVSIMHIHLGTYTRTKNTNITLSAIKNDQLSLGSDLSVISMIWLYSSNIIAIICSMGLLIPWAKIRIYRYRINSLKLKGLGSLDSFIASSAQDQQAIGEGIADIFDVEIGL
jgi:uncharacterized membrane protein YjgN (DUF898 family)